MSEPRGSESEFFADVVPFTNSWFSYVFTYHGPNRGLSSFYSAIELIMANGYLIAALLALVLNLVLPEYEDDVEDEMNVGSSHPSSEEGQSHSRKRRHEEGSEEAVDSDGDIEKAARRLD